MKSYITGRDGFLGTHLSKLVGNAGGSRRTGLDILDPSSVRAAFEREKPDVIYHLAGEAATGRAAENPEATLRLNVEGTLNVLEAVRKVCPKARVVTFTSAAVYGDSASAHTESSPLAPSSPYGVSKACVSFLTHAYHVTHKLAAVEARLFNVIGPNQGPGFVVADLCAQLAKNPAKIRLKEVEARRDFIDVRDAVRAIQWIGERGAPGEVYIVSSGRPTSIREVLDLLLKLVPNRVEVEIEGKPSGVRTSFASSEKLNRASGWKPEIPLQQSLADALAYWRSR